MDTPVKQMPTTIESWNCVEYVHKTGNQESIWIRHIAIGHSLTQLLENKRRKIKVIVKELNKAPIRFGCGLKVDRIALNFVLQVK